MRRPAARWDVFICHATEDKEQVVRPLVNILEARGLHIWLDEFSLKPGDSLRRAIEKGLAKSKLGIVVLSPNFFSKEWPQRELDALIGREIRAKRKIIVPVWHNIDSKGIAKYSQLLADRVAISTSKGPDKVAKEILKVLAESQGSTAYVDVPVDLVDGKFKKDLGSRLDALNRLLSEPSYSGKVPDLIDNIIMIVKEQIDRWDVPSVKFATEEIFSRLYEFSGKEKPLNDLYPIYKDLFARAYDQRKQIIGSMIETFNIVMLRAWAPEHNVQKGEKGAKVMLQLAIDFIEKDLLVARDCARVIDNLAGDMFEPEIMSKEILLAAHALELSPVNPELADFLDELVGWIDINEENSWGADLMTYLKDSLTYAEWEQDTFGVRVDALKHKFLLTLLERKIDEQVRQYVAFLGEMLEDKKRGPDLEYASTDLSRMIMSYESIRPMVAYDVLKGIKNVGNKQVEELFNKIVQANNFLRKVYGDSKMITTFDEMIDFLESNSDFQGLGVGITTFSVTIMRFARKLTQGEEESLRAVVKKYSLKEDFDIGPDEMTFTMDDLVYLGSGQYDMTRLLSFLKEVHSIAEIAEFATGVEFRFRKMHR